MPIYKGIIFLLVIIGITSCNFNQAQGVPELTPNEDNVIFITATPNPVSATSAPPTPTPAPTIPPTPTVPPSTLLKEAETQLENGFFDNAVTNLNTIIQQESEPAIRATAAFKLGQTAVQEGLFQQAVDTLTLFITQFPDDSRVPQAHFLRGDAFLGLSSWENAVNDFQLYLTLRPGLLDSYAHERIGDAQLAVGETQSALASYEAALNANRTLIPQLILRERVARILIGLGDIDGTVAQYDAILDVAQNPGYRAEMDLLAATALLSSAPNENAGMIRLRRIFENYPTTASAFQAMQILLENGEEIDGLQRGTVSFNFGDYEGAIDAFNEYAAENPLETVPAEMHLMLGRAYREIGNSDAALVAFQTVIQQYPRDPLFGDALLEQGRTHFLANDHPKAISTYLTVADTYGYLENTAAEALWRAAYLYGENGDSTQSLQVFTRLADEYPEQELAIEGLIFAASAAVESEEWSLAENLFGRVAAIATGDSQAAAYLWVARIAQDRGDSATMEQALERAIGAAPDSYFAARASDIRNGQLPFVPPLQYDFATNDPAEIAETENWLRQSFSITQEGSLSDLSAELQNDPRFVRGNELWTIAAYDEALEEFENLLDEVRNNRDVLSSYQLAIYFSEIGAYLSSQVAAADVIRAAGLSTLEAPTYIAKLRYPIHYLDVVLNVAQRRNIDPLLIFSLIRHESLFNTYATAAAGEKGLTQVIPATGQYIAEQINWPDYQHSDLFRPYAGIEFGAFYLAEQLNRFEYNVPVALSGYNAGPGRAATWLSLSGGDPDLFMASIDISSTQLYVERIYSYHNIYRALYGAS